MFPTPANMFWSISAKPTDLRDLENSPHSVSGHVLAQRGVLPVFPSSREWWIRPQVDRHRGKQRDHPVAFSLSRVFAVAWGAISAANTPNMPLIPKCTCTTLVSARFDADAQLA